MSRPIKERRICPVENQRLFTAENASGMQPPVELAPDELEALRLTDLEELEQNAAAERMNLSRGTLQRLLYAARRKVAFALIAGRSLKLLAAESGGDCGLGGERCCHRRGCRFCPKEMNSLRGKANMKIAVTCQDNQVFQHFGHTPEFAIFEIEDGKINGMRIEPTGDSGHGALAGFLADRKVDVLLCGGIGGGAQMALAEAGIKLVGGVSGDVIEAVGNYLKGTLSANPDFQCHHHDHEAGHACGPNGCGTHSHGEGHSCGNGSCRH